MYVEMGRFVRDVVKPGDLILDYLVKEGRYEGGFAFIFDAVDLEREREVVLKTTALCSENFRDIEKAKVNLRQENRLLQSMVACPNVVDSLGYFEYKGVSYLVLERLPFSLEEAVSNVRDSEINHSEIRSVLNVAHSLATGLVCMEEKGIVNGDISPMNVRAKKERGIYICKFIDFTGAYDERKFNSVSDPSFQCRVAYVAPETKTRFRNSKEERDFQLEPSRDMYSAGITLATVCLMANGLEYDNYQNDGLIQLLVNHRESDDSLLHCMENMKVNVAFLSLIDKMVKRSPIERIKPNEMLSSVRAIAQLYGIPFEREYSAPDLSNHTKIPCFYQK